jgi:streptomycin 6-kinase
MVCPVIDVEDVRARLTKRFGPDVAGWCAGLPVLADDLAVRWGLRLGPAWPQGGTSVVLPCESGSGELLALKLTPDPEIAADEATALAAWAACQHAVTLHDADLDCGALLLERVVPGERLADEDDRWPLHEVAPLLGDLWQHPPQPGTASRLPGLPERSDFVFEMTRRRLDRNPAVAGRVSPELVESSSKLARSLSEAGPVRLLHGDLHPGNVLRGSKKRGLVAIDPRPCLGDPGFDAVDWLLADGGGEAAVQQRIGWLAARVDGLDPDRAWAWCQALAVVLAVAFLSGSLDDPTGQAMHAIARTSTSS